jgi:hypothetical protein
MKYWTTALALVVLAIVPFAFAADEEVKSGLAVGKTIGAFDVTKCAGAEDDGVKIGASLCYRCKYGARPMVMVFSRNADKSLAQLTSKLDEVVAKNSDKQLKAFVNIVGEDKEKLEETAKKFGKDSKNVPVVVPVEYESGPKDYGINPKVETTVIIAKGGKVVANHAIDKDGLTEKAIDKILADVDGKLLK